VPKVVQGEEVEVLFPLRSYETEETAAGTTYKVRWKGSSVVELSPPGTRYPLYTNRVDLQKNPVALAAPRYP
jgi:hypothetical protein